LTFLFAQGRMIEMNRKKHALVCAICAAAWAAPVLAQATGHPDAPTQKAGRLDIIRYESQYSYVTVTPARRNGRPGLAVAFTGTNDLHYYARAETAPTPDLQLKLEATSADVRFGPPISPAWQIIRDPTGRKVEVYEGNFTVFVPLIEESLAGAAGDARVTVRIAGVACTSTICLPPFEKTLTTTIDLSGRGAWHTMASAKPPRQAIWSYGAGVYYLLALAAGLSINVMPCVLPVLPLVLLRLLEQSRQSRRRRLASGLAFCGGVILFFAAFALLSAVLNVTTGIVLDLNSLFRYPAAVIVLFLAIVFFGLVMLDVVALPLPAALAGRQSTASGVIGSAGMGFFAGVLSTPCSGALLGFVLVWAQTQPLLVSSTAIVLMGVGMALPYGVIVLIPSLLNRLPRPGHWMEVFKKATGFLLFFLAVKLTLAALPKEQLLNVLTYGVVFAFCVWMWGQWVDFSTPAPKRRTIRLAAAVLALGTGWWLLPMSKPPAQTAINWRPYDAPLVQQALAENRPVLLEFTADWCTNCKIVNSRVYRDPEVARLIREKDVVPVKADTTLIDYPATRDFKRIYGEAGNVPVSILLRPDGGQEKLRGIFDKGQLVRILKRLPEARVNGREEKLSQSVKDG
jgi:thiol:disulfide interchange protein